MRHQTLLAVLLFFVAVSVAFADSIVGDFNLDTSLNMIASQGQVTFTLNGNGTIAASLVTYNNSIIGFGFDSVLVNLPESGFSPTAPDNPFGWSDAFGLHESGFYCTTCGFAESWTIGNPGDFSSVLQALGGHNASTDFFLESQSQQYGALGHSAVPEPGSLPLIGAGLLGAFAAFRRKRSS
jgi:hypothetical protein